jgi:hypothetical protein
VLINLQPHAKPMRVDVCVDGETRPIGSARDTEEKQVDMRSSLRTLESLVAAGMFRQLAEGVWSFEMHYTDLGDWRAFVEKPTCGGVEVQQEQLEAALQREDGRVITAEEDLARVFERLDPTRSGDA